MQTVEDQCGLPFHFLPSLLRVRRGWFPVPSRLITLVAPHFNAATL